MCSTSAMFLGLGFKFRYHKSSGSSMFDPMAFQFLRACRCRSTSSFKSVPLKVKSKPSMSPGPDASWKPSRIVKPALFTLLFSSASFCAAAIWQYENMRSRAKQLELRLADRAHFTSRWIWSKFGGDSRIGADQGKKWIESRWKQVSVDQLRKFRWNSLSEAQKTFVPILFVNGLVYLAWKKPSIRPLMMTYFASSPTSERLCWPLLFCTFSHPGLLHLLANMFVLNSFITAVVPTLGKEQFVAFYLSAGVVSSLFSLSYRILVRDAVMSVGASGAIMGVLGYTCFKYPDDLLSLIFIPFLVFKASVGLKAIMAIDFACLLAKFKIFDHMAHLAGASFGIFWYLWGNEYMWQKRRPLLEYWHKLRDGPKKF